MTSWCKNLHGGGFVHLPVARLWMHLHAHLASADISAFPSLTFSTNRGLKCQAQEGEDQSAGLLDSNLSLDSDGVGRRSTKGVAMFEDPLGAREGHMTRAVL